MDVLLFILSLPTAAGAWLTFWGGTGLFWANGVLVDVTRWIRGPA